MNTVEAKIIQVTKTCNQVVLRVEWLNAKHLADKIGARGLFAGTGEEKEGDTVTVQFVNGFTNPHDLRIVN